MQTIYWREMHVLKTWRSYQTSFVLRAMIASLKDNYEKLFWKRTCRTILQVILDWRVRVCHRTRPGHRISHLKCLWKKLKFCSNLTLQVMQLDSIYTDLIYNSLKHGYNCILSHWNNIKSSPYWATIGHVVNSCLSEPSLCQRVISKDSSITHQSKWGRFIYLVNTCASLITPHITLKEFHLHQSHDCSTENDFFSSFLLFSRQDGIKSWLSFNSFNVASLPAAVSS